MDLRRWWFDALCDMLRSVAPERRGQAEWHMSYRLFTMLRDILKVDTTPLQSPFSWDPRPPYPDTLILGKPVEFFDQDFVSIHA